MSKTKKATCWAAVLIFPLALLSAGCATAEEPPTGESAEHSPTAALGDALMFHAGFDDGSDAAFARGDRRLYTAASYKEQEKATPGLGSPDAEIVSNAGRFQHALRFNKKNTRAIFYQASSNVAYSGSGWSGTVSFWLSLAPAQDLEPGFCDPIQITDVAYNDAAVWVDFTDANPRLFRLGVFGDLAVWNPQDIPPDKNPNFTNRVVAVQKPPFARGQWTHVVITHEGLGSGQGTASLYLDAKLQGTATPIAEPFTWDVSRAAIRLGVNYVGLFDELAIFNRPLTEKEIQALHALEKGVISLRL
jgi:hypothetical protein